MIITKLNYTAFVVFFVLCRTGFYPVLIYFSLDLSWTNIDQLTELIEELISSNFMPWKRRMIGVLQLDKYIANENVPGVAKERQATEHREME